MASTPKSTTQESQTVIRTLRVRLYPGTAANGQYLEQLAGACRFAWNHVLAGHETDYRQWQASGELGDGPVQSDLLHAGPAVHAVAERTRSRVAEGLQL